MKPKQKPNNPNFSSGPTTKYKGWQIAKLDKLLGRWHRAAEAKQQLKKAIRLTRKILSVPKNYKIVIVPGSATGAIEAAMWQMLGAKPITILAWEKFGFEWANDIQSQLKLKNVKFISASYGEMVNLQKINFGKNFNRDIIFTWNGTTSGVCVNNGKWIEKNRTGLTFCDATSAAFAIKLPFDKLDITTFSWQKVLGGEAGYGMMVLSPRAIERLDSYSPAWPLPKIFRLSENKKLLFCGETINTVSMLCVQDYILALEWAQKIGGLSVLETRVNKNFTVIDEWVTRTSWIDYLAKDKTYRSKISVCLIITDEKFNKKSKARQKKLLEKFSNYLAKEKVAYDILSHASAPLGLRIWCGATVESSDLKLLTKWLDYSYKIVMKNLKK